MAGYGHHFTSQYHSPELTRGPWWQVRPKFEDALTMLGKRRLDNVHELLQAVVRDKTPGGFIETGVWRGGVGILAAAIFQVGMASA